MNFKHYLSVLVMGTILFTTSCKKEEESAITIAGTISDASGPVSGASIAISVKEVGGGTFSNTFTTFYSGNSDAAGRYSHTFEPYNAIEYKIEVSGDDRFDQELIVNPDALVRGATNTYNFTLTPQAWYRVNIRNTSPHDSTDLIQYQISTSQTSCAGCCHNLIELYEGDDVNTTAKCMTTGNTMVVASWVVTKNGILQSYSDSVYCPMGDTGLLHINY